MSMKNEQGITLFVRVAARYPHYENTVYENVTEEEKDRILKSVFVLMDEHKIEDYIIDIISCEA